MLKFASAGALLVMIAAPGVAQSQPQSAAPAATTPQPSSSQQKKDDDRVVCEVQDTIGTRLGAKKVCMTVAQWVQYRQNVQSQTERIQQDANIAAGH